MSRSLIVDINKKILEFLLKEGNNCKESVIFYYEEGKTLWVSLWTFLVEGFFPKYSISSCRNNSTANPLCLALLVLPGMLLA